MKLSTDSTMGRNCKKQLRKSNCGSEIELHVSTILNFKYHETQCNVKKIRTGDFENITVLQNVVISD